MKNWRGIWLPDDEEHLISWMDRRDHIVEGKPTYQYHKYEAALPFIKKHRRAVDIGAHVGLWSAHMARDFNELIAFEPMPEHIDCWKANMKGLENVTLHECALGEQEAHAVISTRTAGSSGDTGIEPEGYLNAIPSAQVEMKKLDSFGLERIDFMKVDCEGFEVFVLRGAQRTLERCKPVVIVEQKPETGMEDRYGIGVLDGVRFLESLGAKRLRTISGDYIMGWE